MAHRSRPIARRCSLKFLLSAGRKMRPPKNSALDATKELHGTPTQSAEKDTSFAPLIGESTSTAASPKIPTYDRGINLRFALLRKGEKAEGLSRITCRHQLSNTSIWRGHMLPLFAYLACRKKARSLKRPHFITYTRILSKRLSLSSINSMKTIIIVSQ